MLNPRLLSCAAYVRQGGSVCDVGTDHALLPVYLVEQGIARSVIAADIGKGPLAAAQRTISRNRMEGNIHTILSDGLELVPKSDLTDIVIAGMGGETIIHILESCPWKFNGIRLILQPMTKADVLRKWLYHNGFAIERETCAKEERFLYAVMQAAYTGVSQELDAVTGRIGKMNLQNPDCLAYAQRQYAMLCKSRDGRIAAGRSPEPFAGIAKALQKRLEELV